MCKTEVKADYYPTVMHFLDLDTMPERLKDKLTGLHNRNYMESRSKRFVRAGDLPVSLIMADCNYLKRTNDTLGHEYGDLLLQRVANVIQESVSPNDIAMRVGGDEFF